jgi:hypothetical protein
MKFSVTGQEKCDYLIEVTAWLGLTVYDWGILGGTCQYIYTSIDKLPSVIDNLDDFGYHV